MAQLVSETERAWLGLGTVTYGPTESERQSLVFRRSLYVVKDIAAGEPFTRDNVRAIRPGYGLPPKNLETVLGLRASQGIKRGTPLAWNHLS